MFARQRLKLNPMIAREFLSVIEFVENDLVRNFSRERFAMHWLAFFKVPANHALRKDCHRFMSWD
jgi:hypothetical protein